MDKQEMVICPLVCSVFTGCKHRGEHSRINGCEGGDGCPACVPVESAQPELPRELPELTLCAPLVGGSTQTKRIKQEGFNEGCKYQFSRNQLEMVAIKYSYQQALTRIAELEAEKETLLRWFKLQEGTISDLQDMVISLKEQLAVFTKYIPEGRFCYMANSIHCEYESGGDCLLLWEALAWDKNKDAYFKAPGCPVPAKEEAQNP